MKLTKPLLSGSDCRQIRVFEVERNFEPRFFVRKGREEFKNEDG